MTAKKYEYAVKNKIKYFFFWFVMLPFPISDYLGIDQGMECILIKNI